MSSYFWGYICFIPLSNIIALNCNMFSILVFFCGLEGLKL